MKLSLSASMMSFSGQESRIKGVKQSCAGLRGYVLFIRAGMEYNVDTFFFKCCNIDDGVLRIECKFLVYPYCRKVGFI